VPRLHAGDDVDRRHGSLLSGAKFPSACEQLVGLSSVPKACRQLHTSGPVSARRRQCGSAQISRLGSPVGQSESLACGQSARGWHSVGTHTGCRSSSAGAAQPGHGRIRPGKAPSIQQRPASALGATREKPSSRCAWKPAIGSAARSVLHPPGPRRPLFRFWQHQSRRRSKRAIAGVRLHVGGSKAGWSDKAPNPVQRQPSSSRIFRIAGNLGHGSRPQVEQSYNRAS